MTENPAAVRSISGLWIAALWCAGGLLDASQTVIFMHALGKQHAWLVFGTELVSWLPWALATPLVISLARRFPLFPAATVRTAVAHCLALVIISVVADAWFSVLQLLFN
ncbi:MAG: hypothetical protein WA803_04355, partial [Steroidobacteraceae bacterium]